ncbi:MAG: hypothetical protein SNJ56_04030 [Termitinemataceae bacterium]
MKLLYQLLWCVISSFLVLSPGLFAEDGAAGVDDLFSSEQDIAAPLDQAQNAVDHTAAFTTGPKLQFSGSISVEGGLGAGYTQWPQLSEPVRYLDGTVGAKASTTLVMNAKPSSVLSVYGDISTSVDTSSNYSWSPCTIGALYFDYYGISVMNLRAGQFATAWGHGRIFNIGNLMSGSGSDLTLRLTFPLVLQGLSFYILANKTYFTSAGSTPAVSEFAYAGIVDHVVGPIRITEGLRYQKKEGVKSLTSIQGTLAGVDIFADLRFEADRGTWAFLGGAFKEWGNTRVYGEYQYSSSGGPLDQTVALVIMQKGLFGSSLEGGCKWEHTFFDNSGSLLPGLTWSGLPNMTLQAALPITYGTEGSRYVISNEDPAKRRIALVLLAKINGSF